MVQPKQGDRVVTDHGEEVVITPAAGAEYNFGPASARDNDVFTCERPGGDPVGGKKIATATVVPAWIRFIQQEHGIKHVVVLLEPDELDVYEEPGLMQAYRAGGMTVHHIPHSSKRAAEKVWRVQKEVELSNEKVTIHCTHGMGRSGRSAALWLVKRYNLAVPEAVDEALDAARQHGVERMGAPRQLQEWLNG